MKSIEEVATDLADRTQEAAAKLHKIFEPHWNVRADVLKTIVSLSSASIVLSVTFSSSLRTLKLDLFWKYLVAFSFGMFTLSLILAFLALLTVARVYELQAAIHNRRMEIMKAVTGASSVEDFDKAFDDIITGVLTTLKNHDEFASRKLRSSAVCFCLAVMSLSIVGAVQLLS